MGRPSQPAPSGRMLRTLRTCSGAPPASWPATQPRGRGEGTFTAAASNNPAQSETAANHRLCPLAQRMRLRSDPAPLVRWTQPAHAAAEVIAREQHPRVRAVAAAAADTATARRLGGDPDPIVRARGGRPRCEPAAGGRQHSRRTRRTREEPDARSADAARGRCDHSGARSVVELLHVVHFCCRVRPARAYRIGAARGPKLRAPA